MQTINATAALQNFWVTYLSPTADTTDAKLEPLSGQYRHKALMQGGRPLDLVAELRARGCTALNVKPARPPMQFFDKVGRAYKVDLLTAIANNMSSGLSASKAFEAVAAAETGPMRVRLDAGLQVIARGGAFSDAIAAVNIYDDTTRILLDAGERTGSLQQALHAALDHYISHQASLKGLIALGVATSVELLMSVATVAEVRFQVIPDLEKSPLEQASPEQLAAFKAGIQWAYRTNDALLWIAGLFFLTLAVAALCLSDKKAKAWLIEQVRRIPGLGAGLRDSALSASALALANLLGGGVTLMRALQIVSGSLRHPRIAHYWGGVEQRLNGGDTVSRALRSELWSPAETMLLSSHQNQAQLATTLRELAARRSVATVKSYKLFGKISLGVMFAYNGVSVIGVLMVLWIQTAAMSSGL